MEELMVFVKAPDVVRSRPMKQVLGRNLGATSSAINGLLECDFHPSAIKRSPLPNGATGDRRLWSGTVPLLILTEVPCLRNDEQRRLAPPASS